LIEGAARCWPKVSGGAFFAVRYPFCFFITPRYTPPVRQVIRVSNEICLELVKHAQKQPREECCGLLAGEGGVITRVLAARNAAEEKTKNYEIAPEELFQLMRETRGAGLRLMGIYHSHPNGNNEPSARDIERAYYPDVAYFVLSPHADALQRIRAFAIREKVVNELDIHVV